MNEKPEWANGLTREQILKLMDTVDSVDLAVREIPMVIYDDDYEKLKEDELERLRWLRLKSRER